MSLARNPLISVVIPSYNYGHYVTEAVESALAQTYPNKEIIVIDDGSTDATKERLASYGNRINCIYQQNKGISAARNKGIESSRGEFIAFLDADDIWEPKKLEEQVKEFEKGRQVGIVGCNEKMFSNEKGIVGEVLFRNFKSKEDLYTELIMKNIVSGGSAAVVRKECFEKLGMFDETLRSSEDWDMWLRIAKDYDIRFVEQPLLKVRVGFDSMSSVGNADKMLTNDERVLQKQKELNQRFASDKNMQRRAYSYRYFCAAWAYWIGRNNKSALKYIWKSFLTSPSSFLNKKQGGLLVKITVGSILRTGIPVNQWTKPLFNILYNIHVFIREGSLIAIRFFYYEPLFRSQCEEIGKGLWMEKLPYISGRGIIRIGQNVRLSGKQGLSFNSKIYPDPQLIVGDCTFIGGDAQIAVSKRIVIGKYCYIANGVYITDNDGHPLNASQRRNNESPAKEDVKDVEIGDDVWIGRYAVILKGVKIGARSIIGANAVVSKSIPEGSIVVGNPAQIIRSDL